MRSGRLSRVEGAWQRLEREGHAAGMEPSSSTATRTASSAWRGGPVRRRDRRRFFREQRNAGADIKVSPYSFREKGDSVEVLGWVRLVQPDGVMADSQGRWTYHFRDDRIVEADYSPASAAAA